MESFIYDIHFIKIALSNTCPFIRSRRYKVKYLETIRYNIASLTIYLHITFIIYCESLFFPLIKF